MWAQASDLASAAATPDAGGPSASDQNGAGPALSQAPAQAQAPAPAPSPAPSQAQASAPAPAPTQAQAPARTVSAATVRRGFGVGRLMLAAIGSIALLGYFDYVLGFATFAVANYFSYFTVQSGMAAVIAFVAGAIVAFTRPTDPPWLDWFRALVTTYILVSGIVFLTIVIESSSRDYTIEVPWSSQLLHFWIPMIALLDWLTDGGKARLPWKTAAWVMVVPAIWGVFTLGRGALVDWYPYFFLDPAQVSGPLETALYSLVAVALFTGISAILTASSRLPPRPWRRPADTVSRGGAASSRDSGADTPADPAADAR